MATREAETKYNKSKFSPRQRARILLQDIWGIGPRYTRTAVEAELADAAYDIPQELHPSPMSMATLLEKIRRAKTPEDRYRLLTQPIPYSKDKPDGKDRPELWFDYIDYLTSRDIIRGIAESARQLLPPGKDRWEKVADLGAGTGTMGEALIAESHAPRLAESVTLVDISPSLTRVAKERYGSVMQVVEADATQLPFPDHSFDLITSSGLVYSLGQELQEPYFREVSRVLKPGGIYLDGDYSGHSRTLESPTTIERWQMAWMIAILTSKDVPFDPLKDIDQEAFFKRLGLSLSYRQYVDQNTQNEIRIRVLEKTADQ